MSIIQVIDLHKFFLTESSPLEVLKGIHLNIQSGESMAIVGASGSGKSTFLHILGTLERPTKGQVLFEGQDVFSYSDKKLSFFRNQTIGFIFQFHHLMPMLTSEENAMLPLLIAGKNKKDARQRAQELLIRVGLKERLKHRPAELSGGEQQRVAIARALVNQPKVLLADEPTGNLDSRTGEEVENLLLELQKSTGMNLIVVTHNENLAERLSKRLHLSDGNFINRQG